MNGSGVEWLKCHGVGRDRVARYFSEYLESVGYRLEVRTLEGAPKSTSRVQAELARPNPSVPAGFQSIAFDVIATGSGCQVNWISPATIPGTAGASTYQRFVTELVAHLARTVSTTSRGAGRLTEVSPGRLPISA